MVKITLTVEGVPDTLRIRGAVQSVLVSMAQKSVTRMQPLIVEALKPPPRVAYPIQWASEKQRRAFFATNGFGGGIPYRRTDKLNTGNRLYAVETPSGATVILGNRVPYAKYVYRGLSDRNNRQQAMHRNSGWPAYAKARDVLYAQVLETIYAEFPTALRTSMASGKRQEI